MKYVRSLCISSRKAMLLSMLTSEGYFILDGKTVCSMFLKEAFSFSSDLQAKVHIYLSPVEFYNHSVSVSASISTDRSVATIDLQ